MGLIRPTGQTAPGVAIGGANRTVSTRSMQTLKFTPHPAVCNPVRACAGPVEILEDAHDRCLSQDRSRIYRVRSLMTGPTCFVIAVDESGTEAAAATAVVAGGVSASLRSVVLTANRPFFFIIHDIETATPLFIGRVSDPTAAP